MHFFAQSSAQLLKYFFPYLSVISSGIIEFQNIVYAEFKN